MMSPLNKFKQFLEDKDAWNMYITGRAGTGKTTSLAELVDYLIAEQVPYLVCAHTHKACGVLRDKLRKGADVSTLHKFLRKRPAINTHAVKHQHVETNTQMASPEIVQVLFVDEYSMVGEKDYMDIVALQDSDYDGECAMKVVYIGDPYQLPPVKDMQTIVPNGQYHISLQKTYRTEAPDLLDVMANLVSYIEGEQNAKPIPSSESLVRGQDLVETYKAIKEQDKVLLAYTNKAVQELNASIAQRHAPIEGDELFSPNLKHFYTFDRELIPEEVYEIDLYDGTLGYDTKYRTLEHLVTIPDVKFYQLFDKTTQSEAILATVFGHYSYKMMIHKYQKAAADSNAVIEKEFKQQAAHWSKLNPTHKLARQRAKAWRDYLTIKDCMMCLDFPHAMTIHKSQGSTYKHVLIDTNDLYLCAENDFKMYLKLMYVAISRASQKVYTN